jgi:uncharacterized protein YifN (PemK superfamily)
MALLYQPRPGAVVMCDFHGFVVPEMVKRRPVVVLARNRQNRELVTVVPLSTTQPNPLGSSHHQFAQSPLPNAHSVQCWAKCDMVATVALARLDRCKAGKGHYVSPQITQGDLAAIRAAVAIALGVP